MLLQLYHNISMEIDMRVGVFFEKCTGRGTLKRITFALLHALRDQLEQKYVLFDRLLKRQYKPKGTSKTEQTFTNIEEMELVDELSNSSASSSSSSPRKKSDNYSTSDKQSHVKQIFNQEEVEDDSEEDTAPNYTTTTTTTSTTIGSNPSTTDESIAAAGGALSSSLTAELATLRAKVTQLSRALATTLQSLESLEKIAKRPRF
jgi:hypothetical protein